MTKSSRYPFYIALDSMDGLMLGQHVYIEKDLGQNEPREGLWISNYYILEEDGTYYVWVSNSKDKLEKRKIEIGQKNEEFGEYQISNGLTKEDYIAIPSENLAEGQSVEKYDTMEIPMDIDMNPENDYVENDYLENDYVENNDIENGNIENNNLETDDIGKDK